MESSRETGVSRLPRGPFTRTTSGSIETVTLSGTGMGCFPMRLMRSPDVGHDLAADSSAAGVVTSHDAGGGGDDRGPHAAQHLGDVVGADVPPPPGTGDALEPRDRGVAPVRVLELDPQRLPDPCRLDRPALDVALLVEDPGELRTQLRGGHLHVRVRRLESVADMGEEVGYRIVDGHGLTSSTSSVPERSPRGRPHAG